MSFSRILLTWFEENARTLPWRGEHDPYKIWVSEIILQQTRVQQGWDYYLRFIDTFPTIESLATASEDQVLHVWQGLGYYSRARNMHHAAHQIMTQYQGVFPHSYKEIRKLKGVGEYTAAAISSIAFNLPYPAIDGNMLRIISRIFGVLDDISTTKTHKQIAAICQKNIDCTHPSSFNQACMDFGSLLCTPKNPKCETCPMTHLCYAFQHSLTETLPIKKNKIAKRTRYFHLICTIYNNNIILEKRTNKDIWQNLYQFPLVETNDLEPLLGLQPQKMIKEMLTHQIIYATFYIKKTEKSQSLKENQLFVSLQDLAHYPMPKIMTSFLKAYHLL